MIKRLANKNRFIRFLKERFFLRFHMSLILFGTFLTGLLVTKIFLFLHMRNMFVRYPLAVLFSYLAFFVFVKIWLLYIRKNQVMDVTDIVDVPMNITESSGGETGALLKPGGGEFGGGGASGSFTTSEELSASLVINGNRLEGISELSNSATSGMEEGTSVAGEAAGSVFEDGGILLIVLGALLALIFGAGIYLVYQAPMILSEAAFDFLLASSLIRGARKLDRPDWMGGIFKTTWAPFVSILVLSFLFAFAVHRLCPQATKFSEVFGFCLFQ
jgi:hypothetical protein